MNSPIGPIVAVLLCGLVAGQMPQNPCDAEATRMQGSEGGSPPPGVHIPQCLPSGWYSPLQTDSSTGQAWCVDPSTGNEIEGTRQEVACRAPTCPKCLTAKAASLPDLMQVDNFVPQCDNTGNYVAKQQYVMTSTWWCVDRFTGEEINGTRTDIPPMGQPSPGMPC